MPSIEADLFFISGLSVFIYDFEWAPKSESLRPNPAIGCNTTGAIYLHFDLGTSLGVTEPFVKFS